MLRKVIRFASSLLFKIRPSRYESISFSCTWMALNAPLHIIIVPRQMMNRNDFLVFLSGFPNFFLSSIFIFILYFIDIRFDWVFLISVHYFCFPFLFDVYVIYLAIIIIIIITTRITLNSFRTLVFFSYYLCGDSMKFWETITFRICDMENGKESKAFQIRIIFEKPKWLQSTMFDAQS